MMPEAWIDLLDLLIRLATLVAAAFMISGVAYNTFVWLTASVSGGWKPALGNYRQAIGRVILVGLEVLLAATILKTITLSGDFRELSTLLALVAIRTAIGWTTSLEINGRWPWQRAK